MDTILYTLREWWIFHPCKRDVIVFQNITDNSIMEDLDRFPVPLDVGVVFI
jgi:hypothetical protein